MSVEAIMPQKLAGGAAAVSNQVAQDGVSVNTPQALEKKAEAVERLQRQAQVQKTEQAAEAVNEEGLGAQVQILNKLMFLANNRLSFVVEDQQGRPYIRLLDRETGDVIREIPPDKTREVSKRIQDLVGIFFEGEG